MGVMGNNRSQGVGDTDSVLGGNPKDLANYKTPAESS